MATSFDNGATIMVASSDGGAIVSAMVVSFNGGAIAVPGGAYATPGTLFLQNKLSILEEARIP